MNRIGRWTAGLALVGLLVSLPGCKGCRSDKKGTPSSGGKAPVAGPTRGVPAITPSYSKKGPITQGPKTGVRVSKTPPAPSEIEIK